MLLTLWLGGQAGCEDDAPDLIRQFCKASEGDQSGAAAVVSDAAGSKFALLLNTDAWKDERTLHQAYDDSQGVNPYICVGNARWCRLTLDLLRLARVLDEEWLMSLYQVCPGSSSSMGWSMPCGPWGMRMRRPVQGYGATGPLSTVKRGDPCAHWDIIVLVYHTLIFMTFFTSSHTQAS